MSLNEFKGCQIYPVAIHMKTGFLSFLESFQQYSAHGLILRQNVPITLRAIFQCKIFLLLQQVQKGMVNMILSSYPLHVYSRDCNMDGLSKCWKT